MDEFLKVAVTYQSPKFKVPNTNIKLKVSRVLSEIGHCTEMSRIEECKRKFDIVMSEFDEAVSRILEDVNFKEDYVVDITMARFLPMVKAALAKVDADELSEAQEKLNTVVRNTQDRTVLYKGYVIGRPTRTLCNIQTSFNAMYIDMLRSYARTYPYPVYNNKFKTNFNTEVYNLIQTMAGYDQSELVDLYVKYITTLVRNGEGRSSSSDEYNDVIDTCPFPPSLE